MYNINHITVSDDFLPVLEDLEQQCFPGDFWSFEALKSETNKNTSYFFLAENNGVVVGYMCISLICDEVELNRICVLPSYRKKGIAYKMLEHLKVFAANECCERIMLEVRSKNESAIALYKKIGFETNHIRKGYYHDPADDAILMSLTI